MSQVQKEKNTLHEQTKGDIEILIFKKRISLELLSCALKVH
jgi:hypothetical protein